VDKPLNGGGQGSAANWNAPEVLDASAEHRAAFATAIESAVAGDTVTMPAGRYAGDFTVTADGTAEAPIIFAAADGARVVIDGSLTVDGDYVQFRNVEVTYSAWLARATTEAGSSPSDIPHTKALTLNGVGCKFINGAIHNTGGTGWWTPSVDSELYGSVMYNNGWQGPDRGHGHGVYMQNDTGTKRLRACVFAQGYSPYGIHAYTQSGSIQGFEIEDIAHYPNALLVGGLEPVDRLTIRRAHLLGTLQLGYGESEVNGEATLEDVTATGELLTIGDWGFGYENITQSGNRFEAAGLDEIHIIPNVYDDDRAIVIVYNAAQELVITLDLSVLPLTVGREYVLRNWQKYDEGYAFIYTGAEIAIPMQGWGVAVPVGASEPLADSSFPSFGAFLLERT
jgi:hypothetical protein